MEYPSADTWVGEWWFLVQPGLKVMDCSIERGGHCPVFELITILDEFLGKLLIVLGLQYVNNMAAQAA